MAKHISSEDIDNWIEENGFKRRIDFDNFLEEKRRDHAYFLPILKSLVEKELEGLKSGVGRDVAEIWTEHQKKSPKSVVEKILRSEGLTKDNFIEEMDDLVRFRILCNYLSDVKAVVERIEKSTAIPKIFKIFDRDDRIWEVRIPADDEEIEEERRKKRFTGVRGYYLVFQVKELPGVKIEVQITTLLENAWDRKDHHLVYEPERKGVEIDQVLEFQMFKLRVKAISDMLYVADEYFDVLRREVEEKKGGGSRD